MSGKRKTKQNKKIWTVKSVISWLEKSKHIVLSSGAKNIAEWEGLRVNRRRGACPDLYRQPVLLRSLAVELSGMQYGWVGEGRACFHADPGCREVEGED